MESSGRLYSHPKRCDVVARHNTPMRQQGFKHSRTDDIDDHTKYFQMDRPR